MILKALWLRPTLAKPLRALATVGGVSVGVAAVISTLLTTRAAISSLGRDVEVISGEARLEVTRPGGVEMEDLAGLREVCDTALLAPVVEGTALVPVLDERVRLLGIDPLVDEEVRDLALTFDQADEESAREDLLGGNGAVLPRGLALDLGLEPGDVLEVVVRSQAFRLPVVAIFEPRELASAWDRVVLLDVARAQELFGRVGRFDRLELRPRIDLDDEALAALSARVSGLLPVEYRVAPAETRREEGERLVRSLEFNLTALSGVSLLVGAVLVATTLATSVVQRRAAISLLRSLGASRRQLARAILFEAGTIGLVGGAFGVVGGWLAAGASLAAVQSTVVTVAEEAVGGELVMESRWILLGLLLGLVTSLLAAWIPLREALRTPPVQNLRGDHPGSDPPRSAWRRLGLLATFLVAARLAAALPASEGRPYGALVSALFLLASLLVVAGPMVDLLARLRLAPRAFASFRVAQAALEAGRRRAAWAAGAVGVAVGLAVSMGAMVSSFRKAVEDWTVQTMSSDLFVRPVPPEGGVPAGGIHPEVVERAFARFGRENVDPYHSATTYVEGQRVELGGGAFAVLAREGGVPFLDGRDSAEVFAEALERGGMVVNEPFSRRFEVETGEVVALSTPEGRIEREIIGVYRDYSGHTGRIVVDREDFLSVYPDEGARSLAIYLPSEASAEAERAAFSADLDGRYVLDMLLNRDLRGEVLAVFDRTFAVTIALRVVASIVAAIAVVMVLTALVHERRRELAVLRAVGGSRRQVFGVVLGEASLLGVAGSIGGLAVGLSVGYVLVAVVNVQSFGWSMPFAPTWSGLFATAGAVLPACLLAGAIPALASLRAVPREALVDA